MEDVKRILILTRSTKHCQKTIRYGVKLARDWDASLTVLHIIHDPFGLDGWNIPLPFITELQAENKKMHEQAKTDLLAMLDENGTKGIVTELRIVDGKPTETLFDAIEKDKIDLLLLPAHHEWHVEHLIYSRSNDDLLRRLPCSVFFVKEELFQGISPVPVSGRSVGAYPAASLTGRPASVEYVRVSP